MRPKALAGLFIALTIAPCALSQADGGIFGFWRAPLGSVIQIAPCSSGVCATLVAIPSDAPSRFDIDNPDPHQRTRPLCDLIIGRGFQQTSPAHADHGTLYDPNTGKTYRGEMTAAQNKLRLRGYIGLKIFGRSETWVCVDRAPPSCQPR